MDERVKQGQRLDSEDWRNLRFFAEKHRSCSPFFINRNETAIVKPNKISQVLDNLERENNKINYTLLAEEAQKELVTLSQIGFTNS